MTRRKITVFITVCLAIGLVFSGIGFAADQPKRGGTLRYAMIDTPPTLDQHVVTSTLTTTIIQHCFETLFTFNSKFEPMPHLAEKAEVKDNGKLIVFYLRQGVPFHNGKEMTSEDVVASLIRWGEHGVRGPILFKHVVKVEADGKYIVKIYLKQPFAPWASLISFANGGPVIYPSEVMESAGKEPIPIEGYIGTGPYKFTEWKSGRGITLERFDNYANRKEPGDGYAGQRNAYLDKLRFIPVSDPGTRINGIKAGDYDFAEIIPGDLFEGLKSDPAVQTMIRKAASFGELFFNQKEGIMTNKKLRQACLAALNLEPVLRASTGPENLWALNGALFPPGTKWFTEVAVDKYSQNNPEKAKRLAKEAGYKGEKIRFMCTTSYSHHYNASVVLAKQLKDAGFNIDLQIYDWATLVSRRIQPKVWDLFFTGHGFVPDPVLYTFLSPTYPGWWDTPKKRELMTQLTSATADKDQLKAFAGLQELFYEEVPLVKTGSRFQYDIFSPRVKGIPSSTLLNFNRLWNTWLE
jgi:peptide/nickel transport system substrate-binding protein